MTLRTLIETENVCSPTFDVQTSASLHLGHTIESRDKHYVLSDKRWMIQSSNRLLFLLEKVGEADNSPTREENIDDNSDSVSVFMHGIYAHLTK